MNCREALEQFGDYQDGQLTPVQVWRLRLHLWMCGYCREYLASYRATIAAEKGAFDKPDKQPTAIPENLVASILSAASVAHSPRDAADQRPKS